MLDKVEVVTKKSALFEKWVTTTQVGKVLASMKCADITNL